jgi:methylenetetrahydrofolate dehydrogenase (NADP+) / methenyltetrahydrofolate cyclohydrolase
MKSFSRARLCGFELPNMGQPLCFENSSTQILSGTAVAEKLRLQCSELLKSRHLTPPHLAVVLIGDDPASHVYVRNKELAFAKVGFESVTHRMEAESATQENLERLVSELAHNPKVHGILVQMPLPRHLDSERILKCVPPEKDVDGYHSHNLGSLCAQDWNTFLPCTPWGVMVMLNAYAITFSGKNVCVVGRSNTVGKPQGLLMLSEDATVTFAHSKTEHLDKVTRQADILVVAAGKAELIGRSHVKEGAVVVDVGIHRKRDGKGLCGDVKSADMLNWASAFTPVPGGVGPMTIAMLQVNAALAAWSHL